MANVSDESRISNLRDQIEYLSIRAATICRGDTYCSVYLYAFSIVVEIFVRGRFLG